MRFTEVDYSEAIKGYKYTKIQKFLENFIASDFRAVEVDYANEYKSASSAAGSLKASIKRFKLESTITCISSNGRVYLINLMKRRY